MHPMFRLLFLPVAAPPPLLTQCSSPGFMADPDSCSAFLQCLGPGRGYRYVCPAGTRYDPKVKNCNHGSVAPACHLDNLGQQLPGTLPPIPQQEYPRPGEGSGVGFGESETADSGEEEADPDSGSKFSLAPGSAFPCPEPGYFNLEGTCREFWVCREVSEGLVAAYRPFRCPNRYLFDPITRLCQRESKVECKANLFYSLSTSLAITLREEELDAFFSTPLTLTSPTETRHRSNTFPSNQIYPPALSSHHHRFSTAPNLYPWLFSSRSWFGHHGK